MEAMLTQTIHPSHGFIPAAERHNGEEQRFKKVMNLICSHRDHGNRGRCQTSFVPLFLCQNIVGLPTSALSAAPITFDDRRCSKMSICNAENWAAACTGFHHHNQLRLQSSHRMEMEDGSFACNAVEEAPAAVCIQFQFLGSTTPFNLPGSVIRTRFV